MHCIMMTSSNGNIFRVTDPLCGEFTSQRWIPLTKASDAELWCFLWSAPWINGWVNNREAGDLRHQSAHYDVIVIWNRISQNRVHPSLTSNVNHISGLLAVALIKCQCPVLGRLPYAGCSLADRWRLLTNGQSSAASGQRHGTERPAARRTIETLI